MTQTQKIGELAATTGLTVRTLHYYEEIGLLPPPARTMAGHRVYSERHVERIYRILLLRRLGLSLDDVASALGDENWDPRATMAKHLADVDARLIAMGRLRGRLARVLGAQGDERTEERADKPTDDRSQASTADLLRIVEDMNMLDNAIERRISILVYADMEAAFDYLVRVFRLGPGKLTRDGDGRVVHGEIHAGDGVVWLHPESEKWKLASPRSVGASTAMTVVMVDDVDAHFRHAKAQGAAIDYEPVDQPYGYREYSARDSEGGMWSFMKELPVVLACS
jgi:DNA-binding transcriptional MerR regulator